MIEHINLPFAQRTALHWEQEGKRKRKTLSLESHCRRYGGGSSRSSNKSDSTTDTTTTSDIQDNRKGVSEEGVLAEDSTVQIDRSTTIIQDDVSEDIAISAIENSSGVATVAIEGTTQLGEAAFDTSENLFREASGNLELFSRQNSELATKFLSEGKNLIKDQNRDSGERIGNTVLIGVFVIGGGFIALQFLKSK